MAVPLSDKPYGFDFTRIFDKAVFCDRELVVKSIEHTDHNNEKDQKEAKAPKLPTRRSTRKRKAPESLDGSSAVVGSEKSIRVCSGFLAAASPFFQKCFDGDFEERKCRASVIQVDTPEMVAAFCDMIKYLHEQAIDINTPLPKMVLVMKLADQFQLSNILQLATHLIISKLDLQTTNFIMTTVLPDTPEVATLKQRCEDFLLSKFRELREHWRTDDFTALPLPSLLSVLNNSLLELTSENLVYRACQRWCAAHNADEKTQNAVFKCVRWHRLTYSFLTDIVCKSTSFPLLEFKSKMEQAKQILGCRKDRRVVELAQFNNFDRSLIPVTTRRSPRTNLKWTAPITENGICYSDVIWLDGYAFNLSVQDLPHPETQAAGDRFQFALHLLKKETEILDSVFVKAELSITAMGEDHREKHLLYCWECTFTSSALNKLCETTRRWSEISLNPFAIPPKFVVTLTLTDH